MPRVKLPKLFSGSTERLAWWASGPESGFVADSCELQGERPAADSSEEMALSEAFEVFSFNFSDTSFINQPSRN